MEFYSVEYWQKNWETLMDRVENGETIGVENDKGERAVMVQRMMNSYACTLTIQKDPEGLSPNG